MPEPEKKEKETGTGEGERKREPRINRQRRRHYQAPTELVDQLIHKYGSRDRAIEELAKQTYDLREDRREADEEIEALKAKVPADGAVVLTGDEKKKWEAVKAIDLPGEKIKERVAKADDLEKQHAKTELSTKRKAVAGAAGVNGDVLDPLLDQFGLEVENKEIQVQGADGKLTPKQVAHVRKAGDANAAWEKLSDVIARDGSPLKPFAAALNTKAEAPRRSNARPLAFHSRISRAGRAAPGSPPSSTTCSSGTRSAQSERIRCERRRRPRRPTRRERRRLQLSRDP